MSPGGMRASMLVEAPPKPSAVTLWVLPKMGRWAPSSGPIRIFLFSVAATACVLPLWVPIGGSVA
jgi:hypothetical protein